MPCRRWKFFVGDTILLPYNLPTIYAALSVIRLAHAHACLPYAQAGTRSFAQWPATAALNGAVSISLPHSVAGPCELRLLKPELYFALQGASSIVGVKSIQEAVRAHAEGADVLLLRREMLEEAESQGEQGVEQLLEQLRDATSGDD